MLGEPNYRLRCPIFIGCAPFCGRRPSFAGLSFFCWKRPSSGGGVPLLLKAPLFWWNRPSPAGAHSASARAPLFYSASSISAEGDRLCLLGALLYCWGAHVLLGMSHFRWGHWGAPPLLRAPPARLLLDEPNFCSGCPFCTGRLSFLGIPLLVERRFLLWRPFLLGRPSARDAPLLLGAPHYCWTSSTFA